MRMKNQISVAAFEQYIAVAIPTFTFHRLRQPQNAAEKRHQLLLGRRKVHVGLLTKRERSAVTAGCQPDNLQVLCCSAWRNIQFSEHAKRAFMVLFVA